MGTPGGMGLATRSGPRFESFPSPVLPISRTQAGLDSCEGRLLARGVRQVAGFIQHGQSSLLVPQNDGAVSPDGGWVARGWRDG